MTIQLLRIILLLESVIASWAIFQGHIYLGWAESPPESPKDLATTLSFMAEFMGKWNFFSGFCYGITMLLVVIAISQRKDIVAKSTMVRLHWIALLLPSLIVFVYGRNIY